jgi:hypothetical protein
MTDLNPYGNTEIQGAMVSQVFMDRWRSRHHIGAAAPVSRVSIRRGHFHRDFHNAWPGDQAPATVRHNSDIRQFGRIVGRDITDLWYPNWTPTTDWIRLPGVYSVEIDQQVSFAGGSSGGNGIAVANLVCDNVAWVESIGTFGIYHTKQRGWLWPWRGWVPTDHPGGRVEDRNTFYKRIPNAQILIEQGYGEDEVVKVFTGLIDDMGPGSIRPDRISISARDFGGVLVDTHPFMWNIDRRLREPLYFVPADYPRIDKLDRGKQHNWVVVEDATDIVRCALRWCGFKEWEIELAGVTLKTAYLVDRSRTWMDVINDVAAQLGYVFFIAEPTEDDMSLGVPVFRRQSVLRPVHPRPIMLDSKMLTDIEPQRGNTDERHIIRVRGRPAKRVDGGRPILGGDMNVDGQVLFTYTYWPPWALRMAGVIKQLTYYNIGSNGVLGFGSNLECAVACVLIAVQIALTLYTATAETAGNPAFGLDSFAFIKDEEASGITSRLYITGRKTTFVRGGDGSGGNPSNDPGQSDGQMIYATELTGSLVDNEEWDALYKDYFRVQGGRAPIMHNPNGTDPQLT